MFDKKLGKGISNKFAEATAPELRDLLSSVYKVWSAFTKTIRAVILKQTEEDFVLKTVYFGKFYVPKQDKNRGQRPIFYQPPSSLQNACTTVMKD